MDCLFLYPPNKDFLEENVSQNHCKALNEHKRKMEFWLSFVDLKYSQLRILAVQECRFKPLLIYTLAPIGTVNVTKQAPFILIHW